jgi:hypothetical protein
VQLRIFAALPHRNNAAYRTQRVLHDDAREPKLSNSEKSLSAASFAIGSLWVRREY